MKQIFLVVEGQTEESFAKELLAPHFASLERTLTPIITATSRAADGTKRRGGGDWTHWQRDLRMVLGQHPGGDVRVSTLFDLYGLPRNFPGLEVATAQPDTKPRIVALEAAMASCFTDWRFIPYLQRHELEALVLAARSKLLGLEPSWRAGLERLDASIGALGPEDVNDGASTAPSKRLHAELPGYEKLLHGPLALAAAGLPALRAQCPRFHGWISTLESF